jgi:cytosine/adenosine deaminase-related metal-dependent hydrolase
VGTLADFVEVDLTSIRTAGSRADQVIYAATAIDVKTVVVGGTTVVRDGAHQLGPIGPLLTRSLAELGDAR